MAEPRTIPIEYVQRATSRPLSSTDDPVRATVARLRNEQIGDDLGRFGPPDVVARETRVARQAGVPPALIDGRLDEAERAMRARSFLELSSSQSALARWALQNPRGAAAAQDDAESLGLLGNAWEGIKNVGFRLGAGAVESIAGLIESAPDINPATALETTLRRALDTPSPAMLAQQGQAARLRETSAGLRERGRAENWWAESALSGLESVPIVAAAALTRNPAVATAIPALSMFGSSRAEARRQGLSEARATLYGGLQGVVEYATERLPMGTLVDALAKRTPFGKAVVRQLATELPGEQVATVLQDLTDWAMLPENENKTFADYLSERPAAALQTAVATVSGTAAHTALAKSVQHGAEAAIRVSDRVAQSRRARTEQQFFDRAGKAAEGSRLRTRDPEAFRSLLREQAEDAGAKEVFIPGEAVREFQQSDRYNPDNDPFIGYDVDEAAATGGDIVMPIEDALTDLVGTPAWEALREDMRLAPGGVSAREAATFEEAMDDLMADMSDERAQQDRADEAERTVREKIVDRVAEMFGVSFTSPTARTIAELFAQRVQTRAARLGQELDEASLAGFEVRQDLGEVPEGARALEQAKSMGRQTPVARNADMPLTALEVVAAGPEGKLRSGDLGMMAPGAATDRMVSEVVDDFKGKQLFQEAQGRIIFDQNRRIIELFQSRNLSTPLHELSHMWLEELRFDAEQEGAPEQLKTDWQTVQRYFAANGHTIPDNGPIPTEAHELWARSGERFFMEGKAPTSALVRIFETFRSWLVNIYKTVDRLKAPITPEIREVFDRLLATDEEIEAVRERQGLEALFKDAASVGMTEAEFRAYRDQVEEARTAASANLREKVLRNEVRRGRALKREMERAANRYTKAEREIRKDQAARLDDEPLFRALAIMREQRVSKDWIVSELGAGGIAQLPVRVPPLYVAGGVHPDIIAEMAGYSSGSEMLESLIQAESAHREAKAAGDNRAMRERAIEIAADEEFARRFGDPLNDGTIEREALAAVHSDMQGEVIASELRVLSRKTGRRPTPYALAREWARGKVRTGTVAREASPSAIQRYARNAAKAGRAAEQAMLKQDVDEAFRQKQFQIMNNALLVSAKEAADEVDAAVKRMDKIARAKTRKSVDQGYLEQAQALLEAVDLKARSQRQIDRKAAFDKWRASRADGEEVFVPESFDWTGTHWTRMSVEALLGLDDTIKSIMHLGGLKQTLLDNKERRDFEEWRDEALGTLEETPGRKVTTELGDPSRPIAGVFANLMKMEVFAAEMDNDHPNGAWTRLLVQRSTEAANYRDEQRDSALNPVAEAYNALPRKTRNRLAGRLTIPEMTFRSTDLNDPRIGESLTLTRWDIVGMALNLGTESNLAKLAGGYGISPAVAEEIVMRELTQEEWEFVQTVWRSLDTLRPHIARAEREMSGVEPEWQEPRRVVTPFGVFEGGYYPVVYDPAQSQRAEDSVIDEANDLFGARSGVATAKGHTITRTDYVAPLLLSPERVLFTHVEKVITRNAYAPWVRDVLKAVKDPAIRSAIDRKFGPEFRQQIEPWLRQQVREGISNETGARFAERFLRSARINLTVVAMGLRWSTGIAQTIGLANSAGRIGANNLRKGMQRMLRNPSEAAEFVFARSPEMLRRNEAMNRDVAEAFRQMRKARIKGGAAWRAAGRTQAKAQAFAFWHIGMIDRYVVSIPTWLGAYEKAINEGLNDVAASAAADRAVRLSQGSGREKDLSAWQSNQVSEGLRLFTMFYTPFNVLLNAQWETGRAVRRGDYRKAASLAFWFLIATPLLEALLAGDWPDDDEEDWATWLARNVGMYQLAGVPVIRDAANYAERKAIGEYATFSPGPIGRIFDASEDAAVLAWDSTFGDDEVSDRWLRTAIETPGYFMGLPTGQIGATANFLKDVSNGDADPRGFWDWYEGLTKGRLPED